MGGERSCSAKRVKARFDSIMAEPILAIGEPASLHPKSGPAPCRRESRFPSMRSRPGSSRSPFTKRRGAMPRDGSATRRPGAHAGQAQSAEARRPVRDVLLPAVLLAAHSPFLFGYAKPAPVNFRALRNPKRDSDISDLYDRVPVGAPVIVLQEAGGPFQAEAEGYGLCWPPAPEPPWPGFAPY